MKTMFSHAGSGCFSRPLGLARVSACLLQSSPAALLETAVPFPLMATLDQGGALENPSSTPLEIARFHYLDGDLPDGTAVVRSHWNRTSPACPPPSPSRSPNPRPVLAANSSVASKLSSSPDLTPRLSLVPYRSFEG
jgi:hypothetical protein